MEATASASDGAGLTSPIGIYTRTSVRSPVIRWILHAKIRHRRCNDVVFVGDDFVQVKQIVEEAHLRHVAQKSDFDTHIRAAAVLTISDTLSPPDPVFKTEDDADDFDAGPAPPQLIVLTLDSNELLFLYLRTDDAGILQFVQRTLPLPPFDRILFQPGEHLTVDHTSRAIAVAANERELVIFPTKSQAQTRREINQLLADWCPVSTPCPLQVDGVIHKMDFLIPADDDNEHIILILIVIDDCRVKAVWIDWLSTSGPREAMLHPGLPLGLAAPPALLIPSRDASFLLITGHEMTLWTGILSGSIRNKDGSLNLDPVHPGNSRHWPAATGWARPQRTLSHRRAQDTIYVIREDGKLFLLEVRPSTIHTTDAGELDRHAGSAFASLGGSDNPDILIAAGEASDGKLVSIGTWPTYGHLEDISRHEANRVEFVEPLPNWASVTDMISSDAFHARRQRAKDIDGVFVTSGRHPYGSVTELRSGIEGFLRAYFDLDELRAVTDVWVLPDSSDGSLIILLSSPYGTTILIAGADFDRIDALEAPTVLNETLPTLTAGITGTGQLVQVTTSGFCVSSTLTANFEDTENRSFDYSCLAIAASILSRSSMLVTVERRQDNYVAASYILPAPGEDSTITQLAAHVLDAGPLSVAAAGIENGVLAVVAREDGTIVAMTLLNDGTSHQLMTRILPTSNDEQPLCDQIAILQAKIMSSTNLLLLCGLRNGDIVTYKLDPDLSESLSDENVIPFGYTTVKLVSLPDNPAYVCAMSGRRSSLISWDGENPSSISVQNIWITDKDRPEFSQGSTLACAQIPSAERLSSPAFAGALVMISPDLVQVIALGQVVSTIPCRIPVSGTPNRLIYAETQRCLVCASLRAEITQAPSRRGSALADETRQIWPIIHFIPAKATKPSFSYHMQPGERVHALLEWSYPRNEKKTYSQILIGGSYIRSNGKRRGRVTFLHLVNHNWEITDVKEQKIETFEHDVYALAQYDATTYVACAGENVYVYRLSEHDLKWYPLCEPFKLSSPGVYVTVESEEGSSRRITISTLRDSLITLSFGARNTELPTDERPTLHPISMGPRADDAISHLVLPSSSIPGQYDFNSRLALLTSKEGQVIGVAQSTDRVTSNLKFEALLPRSLTRIICSPPAHAHPVPEGVISPKLTGCATDGTLVSLALLNDTLRRRLFWLQRICEWSRELSPNKYLDPTYSTGADSDMGRGDRAVPIGFTSNNTDNRGNEGSLVVVQAANDPLNDMHIDGDILARVLRCGGADEVKNVLRRLSEDADAVGLWVRAHLQEELDAVDGMVELVRTFERWLGTSHV